MISQLITFLICLYTTSAAVLPPTNSMKSLDDRDLLYSLKPNEVLPIQPVLVYPAGGKTMMSYQQARAMFEDNEVIYIKLLKRKSYRPKKSQNQINENSLPKEIQMKDIFYVKALTNGQFSHNRLKVYRLPEFYAITVYKKGQVNE